MEPRVPKPSLPPPLKAFKAYALRFISGKYQGGEFPLVVGKELVIGRSSELDMVLVEDMVSRRHAKLSVAPDRITIEDLGSTNGTFVNGEKVQISRLVEGDRILIGTSIIKLVATDALSGPVEVAPRLEVSPASRTTSQIRTMAGSIEEIPLPDLLQLFGTSKKSGVLTIRSARDVGKLYLDQGRVVFASVNGHEDVAPLKSAFRVLAWEKGTFELEPAVAREFPARIELSIEGILMEAMHQIDEVRRLGGAIPALTATLAVPVPLVAPLRALLPGELDLMQLAMNLGQVELVLNRAEGSDFETFQLLVGLVGRGYLRVE